jgi:hypothetical protein
MRSPSRPRALLALILLACWAAGVLPASAGAAPGDPLFVLRPVPPPGAPPPYVPPPSGKFEGPCGLGVDAAGNFYVSDYYHHAIDVYTPGAEYSTQLAGEDPLDGPCGLALDASGDLYVNNFHRDVVRFGPSSDFGAGTTLAGAGVDSFHPTGVAVDATGTLYVDERERIATFDGAGVEGEPIGAGSVEDGYGVAVSAYPATAGFVYVPDAATQTVEVFDPIASRTVPVARIDGSGTPVGHFVSLRDASIAVDDATGTVYVVDDLTPQYTEGHEGVVYAFDPGGVYLGRLKYSIETALPAGLAVDNSPTATQGRIYVTSGNTDAAAVYAYPPGSAGSAAVALAVAPAPATAAISASPSPAAVAATSPAPPGAGATQTAVDSTPPTDPEGRRTVRPRHRPHRHARAHGDHRRKHHRGQRVRRR